MRNKLDGVLIIDKPASLSSAKAVAEVKARFGAAKAGHSGTLDPFATGVLVCCLNQATRLARFFLHGLKTYEAVLRLGVETDTQDCTGRIVSQTDVPRLSEPRIEEVLAHFEGPSMQQPPVFSALKHQGTPLYKLARQGNPVSKPPRPVTISRIRMLEMALPDIRFTVTCSAGTYIRTLCADMGKRLGCGGHLAELRRTGSSRFAVEEAIPLDALKAMDYQARLDALIPMADALRQMPSFTADPTLSHRISQGQLVTTDDIPTSAISGAPPGDAVTLIKVLDGPNRLKAVVEPRPDGGYNYCCVFH